MSRLARTGWNVLVALTLPCLLAAWQGCAKGTSGTQGLGAGGSSSTSGGGGSSASVGGSSGETGGFVVSNGGGGAGGGDAGACRAISVAAHRVPVDLLFLIDRSDSMAGDKWMGTTSALTTFFNDPASTGIGAGIVYFPTETPWDCDYTHYDTPAVPIAPLPGNAFALTNSMPADATCLGTPMYGALKGVLLTATAYQDAHPTHKVNVVLATDGDANGCTGEAGDVGVNAIAGLAAGALGYDGVHTYTIGVEGATISTLDKIAAAGGTTQAYDVTQDISQFSAKIAEIRKVALGCDFQIPPPPAGSSLDPNKVNFAYTPGGMGNPVTLPKANDLADCGTGPGWYFDDNSKPTEIVLCPASCTTVQNDTEAKVSVLFGCKPVLN